MFTIEIATLAVGASAPLLAAIETADCITRWRRIGTISRGASRLHVDFDADAQCFLSVWRSCAAPTSTHRQRSLARVRFGVFLGRRGVVVIAIGAVTER